MITYNHEAYIVQAIEGVLMQKTDFPVELIIGEDCSTDGTREICLEYQNKFPDRVRLLTRGNNLGMSRNFLETFENCKGKYVALCEGDDYWIDATKLQRQKDFLEKNQSFSMCFHETIAKYFDSEKGEHLITRLPSSDISFTELLNRSVTVSTGSIFFKREAFPAIPEGFLLFDWALHLLLSNSGKVRFMSEIMGVYRIHIGGWTNFFSIEKAEQFLEMTLKCKEFFAPAYEEIFDKWIAHCHADVCFASFNDGNRERFEKSLISCKAYWHLLGSRKRRALLFRKALLSSLPLAKLYGFLRTQAKKKMILEQKPR